MSLPPDDDEPQTGSLHLDEPPVDKHDTRPLKPLWPRTAARNAPGADAQPAATVLHEGRPDPAQKRPVEEGAGIDESTDRLRLIPTLPNPPSWRIIFLVGQPRLTTIGLDVRQALIIGRGESDADLSIGFDLSAHDAIQQGVSRQHAVLIPTPEGLLISDLGSTNGTWANGEYLEPGNRYELSSGVQIELGLLKLVVRSVTLLSRASG
jgi:FHA domain